MGGRMHRLVMVVDGDRLITIDAHELKMGVDHEIERLVSGVVISDTPRFSISGVFEKIEERVLQGGVVLVPADGAGAKVEQP